MEKGNKILNPSDIPDDLIKKIREQFEMNVQIRTLRVKMNLLQRKGNFVEALNIGKTIDCLFNRTVVEYIKESEKQFDSISLKTAGIPKQDVATIMKLTIAMFMAIDIIDSCLMDINDTIHKTDKTLSYDMFDDIRELSKMAKIKLTFFGKNANYLNTSVWGDVTDNMYSMIKNKAMSIIRKNKDIRFA